MTLRAPTYAHFSAKSHCIKKFKEWWNEDELKIDIIPSVSSRHMFDLIDEIEGLNDNILNHDKLASILYDIVGSRFLRDITYSKSKTKKFKKLILEHAIEKGFASKKRIIGAASIFSKSHVESIDDIVNVKNSRRWMRKLAQELDLPESVGEMTQKEKREKTEIIYPHVQLNPLYDYQYATGLHIREMLEGDGQKRSLISIPTGAGKTRLVAETLIDWLNDGKPGPEQQKNSKFILWVAQSNELCEQSFSTFKDVFQDRGRPGSFLKLHRFWGDNNNLPMITMQDLLEDKGVIVASIQSLNQVAKIDPEKLEILSDITSCIIIDEAHHSTTESYTRVLGKFAFNFKKSDPSTKGIVLIGLTATPFRGSGTTKIDGTSQANDGTKRLCNRYYKVYHPSIESAGGTKNNPPHVIIDIPKDGRVDYPMRLLGERSYDKDGIIIQYSWTITKRSQTANVKENKNSQDRVVCRKIGRDKKNIKFIPQESGDYTIKLTVEDNEGDTGHDEISVQVHEKIKDTPATDVEKQKILYGKLMKRQVLCDVYHGFVDNTEKIKLSKKQTKNLKTFGEFKSMILDVLSTDKDRNMKILEKIRDLKIKYGRKKILFFACSVEHARTISLVLNACFNINSRYITGDMNMDERIDAIEKFKNTRADQKDSVDVLCNYAVLTTGFDAPNIDCVFVGRPAKSTLLYTQMIGRGMRGIKSGGTSDVVIMDINDNFQVQGEHDEDIAQLGWRLYSDFWKPWHDHSSVLKGHNKDDDVFSIQCAICNNTAKGLDSIKKIFDPPGELSVIIEAILDKCVDLLPQECTNCRKMQQVPTGPKICPSCTVKALGEDEITKLFGYRNMEGTRRPQSYCRKCRVQKITESSYCPYVQYMKNQHSFNGNYQMILGLYLTDVQERKVDANIIDARHFLLKYNKDKKPSQIHGNHYVFTVYKKTGLIENIDRTTGKINFIKIKDPKTFVTLCHKKFEAYSGRKLKTVITDKQNESSDLIDELTKHYKKLRENVFTHTPTSRQFKETIKNQELVDTMMNVYKSYNQFVQDQGDELFHNMDLEDILFDEYFELNNKLQKKPSKNQLDEFGDYKINDYEECFGSIENFMNIVDDISTDIDEIQVIKNINELEKDYNDLKDILARIPHFSDIQNQSKFGIAYYLLRFSSYGQFKRIITINQPENILRKIIGEYNRIKDSLGMPVNYALMNKYSDYGEKIREISNDNYDVFLKMVGEAEKPVDPIPQSIKNDKKVQLLQKFKEYASEFGNEKAISVIHDDQSISYEEWFGSKKQFIQELIGDDGITIWDLISSNTSNK